MTRSKIPSPREFKITHPRLRRIRNNLRKVIQLAVSEEWQRLMEQKRSLMEKAPHISKLPFRKRRLYYKLTRKANWLEQCYLDSIISQNDGTVGGIDTDVSGDRIRVFSVKSFEWYSDKFEGVKYRMRKQFLPVREYEKLKDFYTLNYNRYVPLYEEHPEDFKSFEWFYFRD